MFINQLSVFIENRAGRLEQVLETLKKENINIISLSLADTSDYGMLRLLVSDAEKGKEVLQKKDFSAKLTPVIAVKLAHKVGKLQEVLSAITSAGINIEYMYALATGNDDACIVIKTSNLQKAVDALKDQPVAFFTSEDAANMK